MGRNVRQNNVEHFKVNTGFRKRIRTGRVLCLLVCSRMRVKLAHQHLICVTLPVTQLFSIVFMPRSKLFRQTFHSFGLLALLNIHVVLLSRCGRSFNFNRVFNQFHTALLFLFRFCRFLLLPLFFLLFPHFFLFNHRWFNVDESGGTTHQTIACFYLLRNCNAL